MVIAPAEMRQKKGGAGEGAREEGEGSYIRRVLEQRASDLYLEEKE